MTPTMSSNGSAAVALPNPIFEGSEKRVEIDFRLGASAPANGLRSLSRETLDELMTLARCCIVSSRHNAQMDAYVLSESSLFVYPCKWVLKTCGTTRLLASVPRLLEVAKAAGLEPRRVKYTRASFLFPDQQPFPYTSFDNEVTFLEQNFGPLGFNANAYVLGEAFNGLQWHVYVANDGKPAPADAKATVNIEVCMTELGRDAAQQFYRNDSFVDAATTTRETGIAALKPGAVIDDYVFEPCGYSMNGIDGGGLITIHITPEAGQSYASVEISGSEEDLVNPCALLAQVTRIFRPGKATVTLTTDAALSPARLGWSDISELPAGFSCLGASSAPLLGSGRVAYLTLTDSLKDPGSPGSVLHHAGSFLSVMSTSDSDGDGSASEPEAMAETTDADTASDSETVA